MNTGLRALARQHGELVFRTLAQIARSGPSDAARMAYRDLYARGLPILAWLPDDEDLVEFLDRVARGERIDGLKPTARQRLNAMIWATRLKEVRAAGPPETHVTKA